MSSPPSTGVNSCLHQSYENPAPVVDAKVDGGVVKVRSVRLMVEAYEPPRSQAEEDVWTVRQEPSKSPFQAVPAVELEDRRRPDPPDVEAHVRLIVAQVRETRDGCGTQVERKRDLRCGGSRCGRHRGLSRWRSTVAPLARRSC